MIAELLNVGAENAIKCCELVERTGHDSRTVYAMIERERNAGVLICANDKGYYLPKDLDEIRAFYKRYTSGAKKMFYTARHFKAAAEQVEGQNELWH